MHRNTAELEGVLDDILEAPSDSGDIEMIVRRPDRDQRECRLTRALASQKILADYPGAGDPTNS